MSEKEMYKNYRITANIHNRSEDHCTVRWEVMRPVENGWEGVQAFMEDFESEITDDEAIEFGFRRAREYVDEKL